MKNRNKEILVGLVTVTGLIILMISIFWGKKLSGTVEYKKIAIRFENSNNLRSGDEIFVRGVDVGRIVSVELKQDHVFVIGEIDQVIDIKKDAVASVINKELMGGRVMLLDPGVSDTLFNDEGSIMGKSGKSITETVSELGNLVNGLEELVDNINVILPKKNLDVTIGEFTDLARSLKSDVKELKKGANFTLKKADVLIDSIGLAIEEGKKSLTSIGNLAPDLKNISVKLDSFIVQSDVTVKNFNKKLNLLQDTTNTVGKVFTSPEMYLQLEKTINGIDSLVRQIKKEGFNANIDFF